MNAVTKNNETSKTISADEARAILALDEARRQWKYQVELLKENCQHLVDTLQRTIRDCDLALNDQPFSTINALGVVQGAGLDIDRVCAKLEENARAVSLLKWVVNAEKK